ncbi:hypothetical protein [uncultured Pseudokineococcus sp.]|uniref:hypothetical protein n=1 Tax=uncultured Pseudokineococcus sp. TaxID=1642928 RepID=UPI00262EF2F7|nr:hypothetical protein [uncultured Pseudokineococcus sp.]
MLHELAAALADVGGHLAAEVLVAVVAQLEARAGAPLGATDGEPVVVLQRRAARALRVLHRGGATADPAALRAMTADLHDPCAALLRAAAAGDQGTTTAQGR